MLLRRSRGENHTMGETITLTAGDGHKFSAYEGSPPARSAAGCVVVQEIFGVNAHIRPVAGGYAAEGYHVISPAIFDRAEPGIETRIFHKPTSIVGSHSGPGSRLEPTLRDIAASVRRAAGRRARSASSAIALAARWPGCPLCPRPGLVGAVGYDGGMVAANRGAKPRCPVMLHFGEDDGGIPLGDVAKIRAAIDPATVGYSPMPVPAMPSTGTVRRSIMETAPKLARERTLTFRREHVG